MSTLEETNAVFSSNYKGEIVPNDNTNTNSQAVPIADDTADNQELPTELAAPPEHWKEHWLEHDQRLSLVHHDQHVAVYYDKDVSRSVTWPFSYMSEVWQYTKKVYGKFGSGSRLYAVFHAGKYSGGHPSTYFDASHDHRNVIDVGPGPWKDGSGLDRDLCTHEVSHIVELASKGKKNSPARSIWGDSKWAEIFIYDVYRGLDRNKDAERWHDKMKGTYDDFPRAGTQWFKDWFHPIYYRHGGTATLNQFFHLLFEHFPKNDHTYTREMNWGEFVHFWSGAAHHNLKSLATEAFG